MALKVAGDEKTGAKPELNAQATTTPLLFARAKIEEEGGAGWPTILAALNPKP